jgi:hypothetical protein
MVCIIIYQINLKNNLKLKLIEFIVNLKLKNIKNIYIDLDFDQKFSI